ncbi:hypothetical protein SteCoe_2377 [Stentor coeruleus]|uniref:Translin-associated factor X-interacting protein 1 N-terminal domain-containing protein n=1 Tax=Stentor coeruleus TaxID=5963 RepID=A0A1R2CZP3_9CILI|nr:hypothetical protein SteCoe_2377 [Stentor coeruleus]
MSSFLGSDNTVDDLQLYKGFKKASRRSKAGLSAQGSKTKFAKPQLTDIVGESPYAQIQAITKTRSISSIKLKPHPQTKNPYLNTSTSNAILTKTGMKNPLHNTENSSQLKQRLLLTSALQNSGKSSAKRIEEKLNEGLKRLKDKQMTSSRFDIFRMAFTDIIENDDNYGNLLKKIKEAYEQRMKLDQIDTSKELVEKLKEEIRELREKVTSSKEDKKFLVKKIEKLAKENTELSRHLDDREGRYVDLQDKLIKLSKIDLEEIPKDDDSWKYLVSENQHLLKVCEEMRKDIKHLSRKEKKLVKLIVALKNRGYPIEDVYQEDVHKEKKKKVLTCDEPVIDDSENEDLVSGRPLDVKKPDFIPKLNLVEIEGSQESSASSSSSESEEA